MYRVLFLVSILTVLFSCENNPGRNSDQKSVEALHAVDIAVNEQAEPPSPEHDNAEPDEAVDSDIAEKKIIKNGSMTYQVDDLTDGKRFVDSLVRQYQAYYSKENLYDNDYRRSFQLTIRIPAGHFESFIDAFSHADGQILQKEIHARDVTEEFIDLETRLANKRNYMDRYTELLQQARTVDDILAIQEKIRNLEEEIESAEGRLRYLRDQVSLSTLRLDMSQEKDFRFDPPARKNFFEQLKKSISGGWWGFVDFLLILARLWPLLIAVALMVAGIRAWRRRQ